VNWPVVQFKDVAQVVTGSTPKKVDGNYNGCVPFVTPGDLGTQALISSAKVTVTQQGANSGRLLPKGTVLVCCIGATIGKVGIADREVISNQQINSLIFDESKVFPMYGYYFCTTIKHLLVTRSSSTTMPIVNKSNFSESEIPLPPLTEQKCIAAILDKADAIRRKRQQAIQLADDFLRAVFLDMFGDPVTNPKGWKVKPLSALINIHDKINYGIVQPGEHVEGGIPIVRVGDIVDGAIAKSKLKRVSTEIDIKNKKSRLVGDEILITCVGATVGKVALADKSLKDFNTVRALTRIRLSPEINRHFVFRYLQSPYIQGYFQAQLRTVGQPTLNGKQIAETPILIPNIELQRNYLSIAEAITKGKNRFKESSVEIECCFKSLSQKAFNGKL
jgi:type I restriction enzyme S subunit